MLFTPEVLAQLERFAALPAETRNRLPPIYQRAACALVLGKDPLAASDPDPASVPAKKRALRSKEKAPPAEEEEEGYESPLSDAPSTSPSNPPLDNEDEDRAKAGAGASSSVGQEADKGATTSGARGRVEARRRSRPRQL